MKIEHMKLGRKREYEIENEREEKVESEEYRNAGKCDTEFEREDPCKIRTCVEEIQSGWGRGTEVEKEGEI